MKLQIPDHRAGDRITCPGCKEQVAVPRLHLTTPTGFRCPFCQSTLPPKVERHLSQLGVFLVIITLLTFLIPLTILFAILLREERRRCSQCGIKLG
jgi:hypothetical protein